jgi:hypothetical protein
MTQFTRVVDGSTELRAVLFNDLQEAIEQQSFNIQNYEGTDTDKISAAIIDAASGGTIIFPPGSYTGDGATRHDIPENVTMSGYGAALDDVLLSPGTRSRICGFSFTGTGTAIEGDATAYTPDVVIQDCAFDGWEFGIADYGSLPQSDDMQSGWIIRNNLFEDCDSPIFSIRCRDHLIEGNTILGSTANAITIYAGLRNRIVNNTIDGGVVGISFVFDRSIVGISTITEGNVIAGNTVRGFSEEGISFDLRGNDGDVSSTIETDVVGSNGYTGPNYKVILADAGWSAAGADVYSGYYVTFLTGALAGRSFHIDAMLANNGTLVFAPTTMTEAEMLSTAPGDYVSIGAPSIGNIIQGNHVDASDGLHAIMLYGNCFNNVVSGNTVIGNIGVWSLEGLSKPTVTYTDNFPRGMSLYNSVTGNTVVKGDIDMMHFGFGVFEDTPTFLSVGNTAIGNTVIGGEIIADGHAVIATGNSATYDDAHGGTFDTGDAA